MTETGAVRADTDLPPLLPLAQAPGELDLVKESWRTGVHDLVHDGQSYARFDYVFVSGTCSASTADAAYAFSRKEGFIHPHVDVTTAGGPVGSLDLSVWRGGGTFTLNGSDYEIGPEGIFGLHTDVKKGDVVLFDVKQTVGFGSKKATVTLTDAGKAEPDAALLLLLAVDLVLLQEHSGGGGWV